MDRKPLSKRVRFEIFKRDDFACQYCGHSAPQVKLHVDHLKPIRSGGTDDPWNLITACEGCNLGKSAGNLDQLIQVRLIVRNKYAQRFHEELRDFVAWPLILRAAQHFAPAEIADVAIFHSTFRSFMSELEDLIASAEIPTEDISCGR
jgi:hypothetical protein